MELIDRLAIIKALDEAKIKTTSEEYDRIIDVIGSMPTIEERKKGKWISHIEHGIHGDIQCWVCSECRELFSYDAETGIEITNYTICPNCGAEMEGSEE